MDFGGRTIPIGQPSAFPLQYSTIDVF